MKKQKGCLPNLTGILVLLVILTLVACFCGWLFWIMLGLFGVHAAYWKCVVGWFIICWIFNLGRGGR